MRLALALTTALTLAGCAGTTMQSAVPVAVVTDAQRALASYQAALGIAQVAFANDPLSLAKINAVAAKAAPYVAQVQAGVTQASTAPTLASLAAELLIDGAAAITATPNGAPAPAPLPVAQN